MKKNKNLTVIKKIPGISLIVPLVLTCLTFCEKPDHIILNAQSDVRFPEVDPMQENPDPTDPPDYLNPGLTYGTITDIEGNTYRTIQIGTQTWMAENLRTTRFNDGSNIRNGLFGVDTKKSGSYWWYDNDPDSYKKSYGALYNWYAVNTKKLCPTGWHVPSDEEWKQLELHLGMTLQEVNEWTDYWWIQDIPIGRGKDQGQQLKAQILWQSDGGGIDNSGTNASGFSAIPGGYIYPDGYSSQKFWDSGSHAIWWTSTATGWGGYDEGFAINRELFSTYPGIFRLANWEHTSGFSVRCVKNK